VASAAAFGQIVRDQFDVLHREAQDGTASVMTLAIHPFIVGQPFRAKYLAEAFEYIRGHDDVWFTTSDEIADWYLERHYDEAVARL
jgi:allantoinase